MKQKTNRIFTYIDLIFFFLALSISIYGGSKCINPLDSAHINKCIDIGNNIYYNEYYTYTELRECYLSYNYIVELSWDNITVSTDYYDTKVVLTNENNRLVSDVIVDYPKRIKNIILGGVICFFLSYIFGSLIHVLVKIPLIIVRFIRKKQSR